MSIFKNRFNQIIANSPQIIRNTQQYKQKVEDIRAEITLKYDEMLKGEKNSLKRVLLHLKKSQEINRAIRQLTSLGNLYIAVGSSK